MKALELATYIRFKTRTTTTTFTDAEMLPLVKFRQDEIARRLMDALSGEEDIFLTPETADLVASTSHRDYSFPQDTLSRIKRVEAALDGSNWIKLYPIDIEDYKATHLEADIINHFNNSQYSSRGNPSGARYDVRRKSIFIYSGSITALVGGLKLWCFNYPALLQDLTDNTDDLEDDPTTTTHGFPREFHELLARGVIIDYKESREKPIALTEREGNYELDLRKAIATVKRTDEEKEILGEVPYNDGSQY